MDFLDGLNSEQQAAVMHGDGPLLVVAGAGTGKTQVITRRIAYLIGQGKAKPGEVLALTFTEKAAREMAERLYDLIGWQSFQVPVMTFHAFGTELLSRFASHSGRSIRGGLLNDTQKTLLLKQHITDISLTYYGPQSDIFEFLEGVVDYIGSLQNAGVTVGDYEEYVKKLRQDPGEMHPRDVEEQSDLAKLYRLYESVKETTGTFDFNDQLQLPLGILRERPNLAERLSKEYRYVLVDEYQDTNRVQDELLRTFVGQSGNLFAVGDDDQAIYGFRGAEIGNILEFARHFNVQKPAVLVRNYRSGQSILDAAYRLIQGNDPDRLEYKLGINKRLIALHDDSTARYVAYGTAADEVEGIVAAISERISNGQAPAGIAVLASAHAPLKAMAKAMRSHGLPFALATSVNIFEQPELIGLWYLMKWLCWQASDEAIGHVIMGPLVQWTSEQYRTVLERSRDEMVSVEEALRLSKSEEAQRLVRSIDEWRGWAKELPVSQLAYRLIFDSGRADEWRDRAQHSRRMVRVFEDLQRLLDQMQDFESVAINTTLVEYSNTFPVPPALEVSEPVGDAGGVQLLTVHASKGLEFDAVYLVACTQRSWSGARTPVRQIPQELVGAAEKLPPEHEYRRLMYVAVTRAKSELFVSSPTFTNGGSKLSPTPFVKELFGEDSVTGPRIDVASPGLINALNKLQRFYPLSTDTNGPALPFEDSEGWLELGVTQLGSYDYCPFEFYVQNVLQIKQPMGPQMAFGNALHKTFEALYRGKLAGYERPTQELHALLDELWSDRGYASQKDADSDRSLAHQTLNRFIEREAVTGRKVVGSEVPVRFEVPEAKLRLRGKIDALFETEAGLEIRDFKTGRTKTSQEKLEAEAKVNFQLRSYALAYQLLNGSPPARVVLDYVVTDVEGAAVFSAAIMRNHRDKLVTMAEKLRAGEFAPNPSPVHTCAAIRYYGTGEQDELLEEAMARQEENV